MSTSEITTEQIVAFVMGEADPREAARIESRAAASPAFCGVLDEVRQVVTLLRTDGSRAPSQATLERAVALANERVASGFSWAGRLAEVGRVIAELIYDSRRQPALAGFRGAAASPYQLTYRSTAGTVELTVAPRRPRGGPAWQVRGQVSGARRPDAMTVALVRSGTDEEIARTQSDQRGYFSLETATGTYDVLIDLHDQIVTLQRLAIGGN